MIVEWVSMLLDPTYDMRKEVGPRQAGGFPPEIEGIWRGVAIPLCSILFRLASDMGRKG